MRIIKRSHSIWNRSFESSDQCGGCVQGWLGAKDNIIHAGEGPIPIIRWAGTLVAWANNVCVRVSTSTDYVLE